MFDFLLRQAPESHLPEAHDSHTSSHVSNHKKQTDIVQHTKSSNAPFRHGQWKLPFSGIPVPDGTVGLHLHTLHSRCLTVA